MFALVYAFLCQPFRLVFASCSPRVVHIYSVVPAIYALYLIHSQTTTQLSANLPQTTMRRPGPLQDLPLEHFLPPNPNLPKSPFKLARGSKRPLSPGAPSTFSPAKRRILVVEGIYSPESLKSPLSSSIQSPARFADLVKGPDSPARRLDFGLPKNHSQSSAESSTAVNTPASSLFEASLGLTTPTRKSTANSLAPSPELVHKSATPPIASSSNMSLNE